MIRAILTWDASSDLLKSFTLPVYNLCNVNHNIKIVIFLLIINVVLSEMLNKIVIFIFIINIV